MISLQKWSFVVIFAKLVRLIMTMVRLSNLILMEKATYKEWNSAKSTFSFKILPKNSIKLRFYSL